LEGLDISAWQLIVLIVINSLALLKIIAPKFFDAAIDRFKFMAEEEAREEASERETTDAMLNSILQNQATSSLHDYAQQEKTQDLLKEAYEKALIMLDREMSRHDVTLERHERTKEELLDLTRMIVQLMEDMNNESERH